MDQWLDHLFVALWIAAVICFGVSAWLWSC